MSDAGVSDRVNAQIHEVAVKTIKRWRRQYQELGLPRGQGFRPTPCPRCDGADLDEAAYALLLGWYLGDGSIAEARREVFTLQIANDDRYPELTQEIAATMRMVKPTGSPCLRGSKTASYTRIEVRWKHWPCLFPQHGPGRKHLRRIELAGWQQEIVAKYPEQLVRGLFHSDGCRFVNWASKPTVDGGTKRYHYIRYMFSNESDDIRNILTDALDLLGIPWRKPRVNVVAVSRRAGVDALDRFVGGKS
ncbi:transcriptional regulator [Kribbella sp. CA-293567]|uniref:transcriptional regulator n=1 Tax=Kribbella sp. CA-293567 TaxID=3002436 RepID=UPI0022DCEA23|nr:transcriptional regulator [Kribbella sp. CA-293567]WBQ02399.1 transcriptional regulator [Kribbella sp. CA-293567]